jgi:CRP-like cAMP-binding protein
MTSTSVVAQTLKSPTRASIRGRTERIVDDVLASLPKPEHLSAAQRHGIIARYAAVLEGNFIYWMTGAYLSVRTEESRAIILDNLHEEVRDCHPGMMRRFAVAANAVPTASDFRAVSEDLLNVRLFVGRLSAVRLLLMMAFFEGFIQRFMAFLAELARRQGSVEQEYTEVHGVCDIAHTDGLFRALAAEMSIDPCERDADLFEGVDYLRALIQTVVHSAGTPDPASAFPA